MGWGQSQMVFRVINDPMNKGLLVSQVRFVKSASHYNQFPPGKMPEVAIAGRSNAGKSSFINTLANQKIAKVSGTPGKTRLLNIFDVEKKFWLVDMPGYGYAARSHLEREQWEAMIGEYLENSQNLKGIILIMDIRRDWSEDEDMLLEYCQAKNLGLMVGLTKADKLSRSKWKSKVLEFEKELEVPCFAISSLKNWGIRDLVGHILQNWL